MNKKDLSTLKKNIGAEDPSPISRIASCYVDIGKHEAKYQDAMFFGRVDLDESYQYISFAKKGLTGKIGKNILNLSTDGNILDKIRKEAMQNMDSVKELCDMIIENYPSEENYAIIILYGCFDIPAKEEEGEEESEYVHDFVQVLIHPCSLTKPGITYDYKKNVFEDLRKNTVVGQPVYSFFYPSLDDGTTDLTSMVFYSKNNSMALSKDLLFNVFSAKLNTTPEEQKTIFDDLLTSGFQGEVPFDSMKQIYQRISEISKSAEYAGETSVLSTSDITDIISEYADMGDDDRKAMEEIAEQYEDASISPANIAPGKISIETEEAIIKISIDNLPSIKKETIKGEEYYLIPVRNSTVEKITVS